MIISWNWLAEYVRLDLSADELARRLALSGLNHESTEEVGGDLALDLEVTSNRPDCLGHLGVAREVAVLTGQPLREPAATPPTAGEPVESLTAVEVEEPALCSLFTARVVSGVADRPSPAIVAGRLESAGVRPISGIVDATNYVMLECGQPLHAYDLDKLEGRRLIVRRARAGETLRAINGKTYELTTEMLVIADARRPVGLAGVMGGLDTEIGPETRNVLIEAARFDPLCVRRTARALGLHSPSSYRFERGIDPERTDWASRRCAELVLAVAGGQLHPGAIAVGNPRREREPIVFRQDQIRRILGIDVPADRARAILRALGVEEVEAAEGRSVHVAPSWRPDLSREIDLIEEVARIHGYEHIPEDRAVPLARSKRGVRERVEAEVRGVLTGLGFDEATTFSLVGEPLDAAVDEEPERPSLRVEHAGRKKDNALRQSLVPSLLAARAHNEAHGTPDAALFELADVYGPPPAAGAEPAQEARLAFVATGDFAAARGVVEAVLDRLHVAAELEARPASPRVLRDGRAASLALGGEPLGFVGEVDPAWVERLGLRGAAIAGELRLGVLIDGARLVPQFRALPTTPAVARDLSLVVDAALPWAELARAAREAAGPRLEQVEFLDSFAGGDLPAGRASVHFGLTFRDPERTLTGAEVEEAVGRVASACGARFGATLRG